MMEEPVVKSRARHLANRLSALAAAADAEAPPKLSRNYLKLAADYRQQQQYRPSSTRSCSSCISCKQDLTAAVTKVLYPCQHCCCDNCMLQKRIRVGGQCLCQSAIHIILKNRGGRERQDYDDWLALGASTIASSSFVKDFPLNSQLEIRWATVDRRNTNDKPIRLRSKTRKASQILPVVMEGATTDEEEEDETSSSGRTATALLPIRREIPNEQGRKTGLLCSIL